MHLDDLLSEVDGIGGDQFTPSTSGIPATLPLMDESAQALPHPPEAERALGSLEMMLDVEMELTVELGQTQLTLRQLMALRPGDQFSVEQQPEQPLTIYANERPVARGEAVIVDGILAVRITELLGSPQG